MILQKDTVTRYGIDKISRRILETILRYYPDSIEINELNNLFDKWDVLRLIDQLDDD